MRFKDEALSITWSRVNGEPKFKVLTRSKKVKFKKFDFDPYFFIYKDKLSDAKSILDKVSAKEKISYEIENLPAIDIYRKKFVVKISTKIPSDVKKFRLALESKGIETFEADIPYVRRHLIDTSDHLAEPKNVLYFDIEVNALQKFPTVEEADQRILSIAAVDTRGKEYFFSEDKEVDMILDFLDVARKYDLLAAYNADIFDIPYLVNRAAKLGLKIGSISRRVDSNGTKIRIFEYPHIDLLKVFKTIFKRKIRSYALKAVARDLLGKENLIELETREDMQKLWKSFNSDKKELREYNLQDCYLLRELDKETRLVDFQYTLSSTCHLESFEPRGMSTYVESLILYLAQKNDPRFVFKTKSRDENDDHSEDEESYTGGYVKDPVSGIHRNIVILDLKATYPSIIKTFNIGLETFREDKKGDILAPHGSFINSKKSILKECVENLQFLRDEAKNIRNKYDPTTLEYKIWDYKQFGYKFLINSIYGICGYSDSRLFNRLIAENITLYARSILKVLEHKFKEKVLYADTDGLFLKLPDKFDLEDCIEIAKYLEDSINRYLKKWIHLEFGVPTNQIDIEIKIDRIVEVAYLPPVKKRYALLTKFEDGKRVDYVHIKGFDCVRGNVPLLCKEIQERIIKHILNLRPFIEIQDILKEYREKLFRGELDNKLVMYVTIRKNLDEYQKTSRHIEAAKILKNYGYNVVIGDKIAYIDTGERVIPYLPGRTSLTKKDYQAFWNNKVIPVLENLHLNIDWKTLTSQKTLADF